MSTLTVPRRYCGPPSSGNGGWTAGALAQLVPGEGPVTVSLRRPPPLDTPMPVHVAAGSTLACLEDRPVAQARPADHDPTPVPPVASAAARAAEASYPGFSSHPFPTCFVCGTDRDDGLRIFPGRVDDVDRAARVAATWTPTESSTPLAWAALDCIGGWAGDLAERLMVLGTMTARIHALPEVGVEHVVVGAARGIDGRKTFTAATVYDARGGVVGTAEHVWIAVDPADFA